MALQHWLGLLPQWRSWSDPRDPFGAHSPWTNLGSLVRRGRGPFPQHCSSVTAVRGCFVVPSCPWHRLPASVPVFRFSRSDRCPKSGVEFLELSSIKLRMKLRETGSEVVEDRSRALKKHELSETTPSREASNE